MYVKGAWWGSVSILTKKKKSICDHPHMQCWFITGERDVTVMFSQIFRSISIDNTIMQMRRPMWLGVSFIVRRAHPLVVHWIIWLYPCITGDCTLSGEHINTDYPVAESEYWVWQFLMRNTCQIITFLHWKTKSCLDANFVIAGGTGGCRNHNLQCHQWRQN